MQVQHDISGRAVTSSLLTLCRCYLRCCGGHATDYAARQYARSVQRDAGLAAAF